MTDDLSGPIEPDLGWRTVAEMVVGSWVEIPIDDEGPPRWLPVVATKPPSWTGEHRWALLVADGPDEVWIKVSPSLVFRVHDEGSDRF